MKRAGYLMERIADPDNLRLAFWKACKGKQHKPEVENYGKHIDSNLMFLREELLRGEVPIGNYAYFRIYDPKERLICAAAFRERVLHHALMNVCHPVFESFQTDDSYATRMDKGQYAALDKARFYTRRYRWFCKLDVRKFFDSIDHETLYGLLCHRFKDARLLHIFRRIIESYATSPGHGLPIGNLTSQYFANYYLAAADHYVRERLCVPAYVRYMDDMALWHNDKAELLRITTLLTEYIENSLRLTLKTPCLNATDKGLPFLGYVLFPQATRLNRNSKKRFTRKMKRYEAKLAQGEWSQEEYARHITPLVAFTRYANALNFRRTWQQNREQAQKEAPTACCAAARGTTTLRIAGRPIGTTTIPTMTTTTSASALSSFLSSKYPVDAGRSEPACSLSRTNGINTMTGRPAGSCEQSNAGRPFSGSV